MSIRATLSRIQRLEQARSVSSPFVRGWGSFDLFADDCEAEIAAGRLDRRDFPVLLSCLGRWENDGTWGTAARSQRLSMR